MNISIAYMKLAYKKWRQSLAVFSLTLNAFLTIKIPVLLACTITFLLKSYKVMSTWKKEAF